MTAEQFSAWLAEMKSAGLAKSDADCARLLGRTDDTIIKYKRNGTDRTVALACRALIHRMEPWGSI